MREIRKSRASDVDAVYEVLLELFKAEDAAARRVSPVLSKLRTRRKDFAAPAKKELLREFRERNAVYLVAVWSGKVVGYARAKITQEKGPFFKPAVIGSFEALAVLKRYRGRGIARALHEHVELWFKEKKCHAVCLEVMQTNPAEDLYKKWGYRSGQVKMWKKL